MILWTDILITNNTILYFSGWLTSVQTMLKAILYKEENILNSSTCIYVLWIHVFKVWKQDRTDLIKIHFQPKKNKLELTFCNQILMNSKDFTRSFVIYKDLSIVSGNKSLHSSSFIRLICIATEQARNYSVYRNGVVLVIQHIRSLQLLFHQNLCISWNLSILNIKDYVTNIY